MRNDFSWEYAQWFGIRQSDEWAVYTMQELTLNGRSCKWDFEGLEKSLLTPPKKTRNK
jgi:hypothetical protein